VAVVTTAAAILSARTLPAPHAFAPMSMDMEDDMDREKLVDALIADHGALYSEEIGADIARDEPLQWFHWLEAALLMSARIDAAQAIEAVRALKADGLHKPDALRSGNRQHLVAVLNKNGYARYDNQGADYLRAAAERVEDAYGGDLRRMAESAEDADELLEALTGFKGIGRTGAMIFAREAQIAWDKLFPVLDDMSARQAAQMGLPDDARELADLAGSRERFTRLVAALVRVSLGKPSDKVKDAAG
jgi:hypothetical protein